MFLVSRSVYRECLCPGKFCPGGLCPGEVYVLGSLSSRESLSRVGDVCPGISVQEGISVQGLLCLGGSLCPGGLCPGGS